MFRYIDQLKLIFARLPGLIVFPTHRKSLAEMIGFCRSLPEIMRNPLPEALLRITPENTLDSQPWKNERLIRQLADMASLLDRRSPLGLCLRRSLTRYHFLRSTGVPVHVHFGAKLRDGSGDRHLAGHAWLSLNKIPYHESKRNWKGFTALLTFPEDIESQCNGGEQRRQEKSKGKCVAFLVF